MKAHAIETEGEVPFCKRCGASGDGLEVPCPAVSDGAIYAAHSPAPHSTAAERKMALVPVEPPRGMVRAGFESRREVTKVSTIYKAMLSAVPEQYAALWARIVAELAEHRDLCDELECGLCEISREIEGLHK